MSENSRSILFRKRNILGTALMLGILVGIYLGKFKGFGLGGGSYFGLGNTGSETQVSLHSDSTGDGRVQLADPSGADENAAPLTDVVRVLIDDRDYFLRSPKDDSFTVKITLPNLIKRIKETTGDNDGIRVRIYERATARVLAEENLKKELTAAGINDAAVFWVPNPVQ